MSEFKAAARAIACLVVASLVASTPGRAQTPAVADPALQSVIDRSLPATAGKESIHILSTTWNGTPVAFVDYAVQAQLKDGSETDIVLKAFVKSAAGYQVVDIDTFEEEGGTAEISAVGFANADKDKAQELIVLVDWPVSHYDVDGTLYEVRIFDDLGAASGGKARYLKTVSKHFDVDACDCSRRDGKPEHYRYTTMVAIKKELKHMGY